MIVAETTPLDAESIRADFPILSTKVHGDRPLVYFDNAATTQRPQTVIDKLSKAYKSQYANVHRGIHWLSELSTELYEQAREIVQQFINAKRSHEVIFTYGTTSAINLVAHSWGGANVSSDDEILLTVMEHHSNIVPWQQLAQRTGCTIKFIPVTDDGQLQMEALDELLSERTKLVAVAANSNVTGAMNPIEEIVRRAHAVGAVVSVDAAQKFPHEPADVQQMGADFVAFSGHKMLGPSGVGVLYGRESLLEAMPPFLGGGSMIHRVTLDGFQNAELPAKFEAGTPPIVPAQGMAAGIDYLQEIGVEKILQHERVLTERAHQVLGDIEGLRLLGPQPQQKCGIASFVIDGIQANDLAMAMDEQGIAVRAGHHCAMPLHERFGVPASVRASFYLYNTLDEVEKLGNAVQTAARLFRR